MPTRSPAASPTRVWRDGLALLSGALLFFSFPKFGHPVLAWVALAPLLAAIPGTRGLSAARLGYVTGASAAVGLLYWTALVVIQFGGLSLPMGLAAMVLLCLAVALFPALFAWATARACLTFGARGLLLVPALWVGTEILRAYTFFRFPWCLLGYSQYQQLPLIQIAAVTGVYGVSFLVALPSAVLAFLLHERSRVLRRSALLGLAVILAAVWCHGLWSLRRPYPESGRVRAGLVQASITQTDKWDPAQEATNLERHLVLSREAAAAGAQLIVWPESAVPFYFDLDAGVAGYLRRFVRDQGVDLVFGNDDLERDPSGPRRVWVGAKLLDREGQIRLRYHKNRLVPFGEYVPLKWLFTAGGRFAGRLVRSVADFTPGEEATVGEVSGHRLGIFICYEAIFPDLIRQFSANGAEILVNVTNDGWYGATSAPSQHFAMAVFRSVENGRWLLRAANTGITGIVDPHGRVVAQTRLHERRALVGDAGFVRERTVYARVGDVFGWACLAVSVLTVVQGCRRRRPPLG